MTWFKLVVLLACLAVPSPVFAQLDFVVSRIFFTAGARVLSGSADPEGSLAAPAGSLYLRTNGSVYIKASGSGNTGWSVLTTITGTLPVGSGGTGATSFTLNGVLYGNGTNPIQVTAAPGANVVLAGNSSAPFFTSTPTASQFIATTSFNGPVVTHSASLTLNPTGDLITDPAGNDILPVTNYDINIGAPTLKYLSLRAAELIVDTLVAQGVIATIGGRVVIAPTTTLTADLASGGGTITVKHNQMASGDRIRMEARGQVEFMSVDSGPGGGAGAYTYAVTRDLDGTGANDWIQGDAVLNTGTTGDGHLDLFSSTGLLNGFGPTIVCNVRTGATYSQVAPRCALGNLNAVGYGHSGDIYGVAGGDPTATHFFIDSANGFVIKNGATVKVQIDASGNASFVGSITAAAGTIGGWNINADTLFSGSGSTFVGMYSGSASTVRFAAGSSTLDSAPFRVTSAGALTTTNITATGGTIGGWILSADTLSNGTGANTAGLYTGGSSNVRFWAGSTTLDSAPFRVFRDGTFVASSATITGALTATSGDITAALVAGSVTSAHIAANTIVAADIAADTITAAEIAANTITAAEIAANAIQTSELDADSVTSAKIVAGTIEASDIAAGTITADKLSVTTLSAITADMGTLTAGSITGGTIDGATIRAGSGDEVTLDSTGIEIDEGTGTANKIKWSDGSSMWSTGDNFNIRTEDSGLLVLGNANATTSFVGTLFRSLWAGSGNQFVCVDNSGNLYDDPSPCDGRERTKLDARVVELERVLIDQRAQIDLLLQRVVVLEAAVKSQGAVVR